MRHIVDTASRIEALALQTPPDLHLSRAECDRIAHLALLLAQERNRKGGSVILTGRNLIPFEQWPEESRATARRTVVRLLEALAMLGYLEPPAPEVIDVVGG